MTKLWYCDITRRTDIVTEQERSHAIQGRNEVKWRSGQETSLAPPLSNLRSFGSKLSVLKNVLVTLLRLSGASRSHLSPHAVIQRHHSDSANRVIVSPFAPLLRP